MGPAVAEPRAREIVGIVGDVRDEDLALLPEPTMYIPYAQAPGADQAAFVIRSRQAPLALAPDVRGAMRTSGGDMPVREVRTMEDVISSSLTGWRFHAILLAAFGLLALVIAGIGIYGVVSYSVSQRTHEIGIRMALGAEQADMMRLVIGQGARLSLIGVGVGVAGAFALTRLLTSLLYGVTPTDPLTYVLVSLALVGVALAACYVPARRATRVNPVEALRHE